MTPCIIVPLLDDADVLRRLLADIRRHATGRGWTTLVVDGGSSDGGADVAAEQADNVIVCAPGRGRQLARGAGRAIAAGHDWLWFVHADSRIDANLVDAISAVPDAPAWGRCDVSLDGDDGRLKVVAEAMNRRSALTHICTGDQGIFVHRRLLEAAGGVPAQPLMEDIELSKRLRRLGRPLRIRAPLATSPRRWRRDGVWATIRLMWWLRARYFLGEPAESLAREYLAKR